MPVYACYRGDCDNLAYQQPGPTVFVAEDALGRRWLCVETELTQIPATLPGTVPEMLVAQSAAHGCGLSAEGTELLMVNCPDEGSLRRQLILDTYPPFSDSLAILNKAGWVSWHESQCTGAPVRLVVTNGRDVVTVEGRSTNEAWHRAARKALNPLPGMQEVKPPMTLTIQDEPVPLRTDEYGVVRIGDSQVLLDVVIREFNRQVSPEGIVKAYSTLKLADVYAVIAYYLQHRQEVDEYLRARRDEAERLRQEIEAERPAGAALRAELLARKEQMEQGHASLSK
jgi:uncharacterized protein (DUF433 family)